MLFSFSISGTTRTTQTKVKRKTRNSSYASDENDTKEELEALLRFEDATHLDITIGHHSRQKSKDNSALFQQSQEFLKRSDAMKELHRIGRRAARLFRKLDSLRPETNEAQEVQRELEVLEKLFHETLMRGNLQLLDGGVIGNKAPVAPGSAPESNPKLPPAVQSKSQQAPGPRLSQPVETSKLGQETAHEQFKTYRAPYLRQRQSQTLNDSAILISTLEEMMEREAYSLAGKIKSARSGTLPGSGVRIHNETQATELALSLRDEILNDQRRALIAAQSQAFDPLKVPELLEPPKEYGSIQQSTTLNYQAVHGAYHSLTAHQR